MPSAREGAASGTADAAARKRPRAGAAGGSAETGPSPAAAAQRATNRPTRRAHGPARTRSLSTGLETPGRRRCYRPVLASGPSTRIQVRRTPMALRSIDPTTGELIEEYEETT